MKTLLLLRHAKSSWDDPTVPDHDRPLNKRGKRDAPKMGRLLKEEGLIPDVLLSSTANRARKTAEAASRACDYEGTITFTDDLYAADVAEIIDVLKHVEGEPSRVLVIGHNPGFEDLVRHLTAREEEFPTAALARIALPLNRWGEFTLDTRGELITVWRPKDLKEKVE
jgi:phosphohistidine phosphatase